MKQRVIMLEKKNSLNIDVNTCKAQGIILNTLYNAYNKDKSREVDLAVLKENSKSELLYFADAISILRDELLIYTPSYGLFGITNSGIDEFNLRKSYGI
jgi:hypothetical protein